MNQLKPWENEPDGRSWTHAGYKCQIVRCRPPLGHLCGYVGIAAEHPCYGLDYSEPAECLKHLMETARIHESPAFPALLRAAFGGDLEPRLDMMLCVHGGVTYSGDRCSTFEPDGLWWIGFDCAHSGDLIPRSAEDSSYPMILRESEEYRDMEYVTKECNSLADQLAAIAEAVGQEDR